MAYARCQSPRHATEGAGTVSRTEMIPVAAGSMSSEPQSNDPPWHERLPFEDIFGNGPACTRDAQAQRHGGTIITP